jgi:uracil-DNA glycosylase
LSSELESLKDLTRALRRRVELSDSSDWLPDWVVGAAKAAERTSASSPAPSPALAPRVPAKPSPAGAKKGEVFAALSEEIKACRACPLGAQRIQAVPGVGSHDAQVMFIGEGPGFDEDHQGEPFIGRSGKLLDKIMESIGLSRSTVYIANIVKCHPMIDPSDPEKHGNDRPPSPDEIAACRGWLDTQIRTIRPRVLVTLGAVPARVLLGDNTPISKIRGVWRTYEPGDGAPSVRLLPTFHPAALLRNPDLKRDVWTDMKSLREELSK